LIQSGIRAIPLGIAAMVLGFILKSAGTQPDLAEAGSSAPSVSVFGTIHPDIFRLRTPLGSGIAAGRLQLASLDPQVGSDAPVIGSTMLTEALPCGKPSFEARFVDADDRPDAFDQPAAFVDGCSSFEERFASAMPVRALASRSRSDDVQELRAEVPNAVFATASIRSGQTLRELSAPQNDGRIAIYDISAHAVYLPNGRRLEAHSGLGELMDNPRGVHTRMRGATPPNVYNLAMREHTFHGVRAIRLNPVDESRMHGRGGILAHTYMLGSSGQSNGCVVFSNYPEFLNAFQKGEITRMVVVDRLESPPARLAAGELPGAVKEMLKATDRTRQYAAADDR
jgi:hypothetical protein